MPAATFEKLKIAGFDASAAKAIASCYSAERIERQLAWIDSRRVNLNRLGMLRTAIEHDWAPTGETNTPRRRRGEDDPDTCRRSSGGGFAAERLLGRSKSS